MGSCFRLSAEWTVYGAVQSRAALLEWLDQDGAQAGDVLEISAADVADIDGAGLQLLVALDAQGLPWRLVDASEAFIQACRGLGLEHWLQGLGEAAGEAAP
ncbi:MAG: STAS domain-containing protein [Rhodoferax sp.]